jgi:hypothetical protein
MHSSRVRRPDDGRQFRAGWPLRDWQPNSVTENVRAVMNNRIDG